jgi:hypothetical protein
MIGYVHYQMKKSTVAKDERQQCCAFGSKDRRRCRLTKEDGKKTCSIHRNYYKTWLQRHKVRPLLDLMNPRDKEEWRFQLSKGYVQLPEQYMRDLTSWHLEWYELFLQTTSHSALLNEVCFVEYFIHILTFGLQTDTDFNGIRDTDKLYILLTDPDSCFWLFRQYIAQFTFYCNGSTDLFIKRFEDSTQSPRWRQVLYSSELIEQFYLFEETIRWHLPHCPELFLPGSIECEDNPLRLFIRSFNWRMGQPLRDRCAVYKEELMAAAWHPRRVERWLEAGGIEMLEML